MLLCNLTLTLTLTFLEHSCLLLFCLSAFSCTCERYSITLTLYVLGLWKAGLRERCLGDTSVCPSCDRICCFPEMTESVYKVEWHNKQLPQNHYSRWHAYGVYIRSGYCYGWRRSSRPSLNDRRRCMHEFVIHITLLASSPTRLLTLLLL